MYDICSNIPLFYKDAMVPKTWGDRWLGNDLFARPCCKQFGSNSYVKIVIQCSAMNLWSYQSFTHVESFH